MQRSHDLQSIYPDCIKTVRIIFSVILYPAEKKHEQREQQHFRRSSDREQAAAEAV